MKVNRFGAWLPKTSGAVYLALLMMGVSACTIMGAAPITRTRCEALDMHQVGLTDGEEAQRRGLRFETWGWDCKQFRIQFDRQSYDKGYDEGIGRYCSCESGFVSGIREEYGELKGQYYACEKENKDVFFWAHEQGAKFSKDPVLVTKKSEIKMEYHDDLILEKAKGLCAARPKNAAPAVKLLGEGSVPKVGIGGQAPGSPASSNAISK